MGAARKTHYLRILLSDRLSQGLAMCLAVVPLAALTSKRTLPPAVTEMVLIVTGAIALLLCWRLLAVGGFASRGVATMAHVIGVDWRKSLLGHRNRYGREYDIPDYAYVTVRYTFNGREYNVGREVDGLAATTITAGTDMEVLVDPSSPGRFVFADLS